MKHDPSKKSEFKSVAVTDSDFWNKQWGNRFGRIGLQKIIHGRDHGRNGAFLRMLDTHVGLKQIRGKRIVELGGAASRILIDLARYAEADVVAVDFSETGLDETKALFKRHRIAGETILADMFNWELPTESFDVVCHWGLLEHFEDPFPVVDISAKLLKRGGLLVFSMPNMAARGAKLWSMTAPLNYSKHVFHSDDVLDESLSRAGFQLTRKFHFGPPLFRMAPPEENTIVSAGANLAHIAAYGIQALAPGIFVNGSSSISSNRGFVALKI